MHNLFGVGGQSQVSQAAVGENSSCLGMILAEIGSSGLLQEKDISCRGSLHGSGSQPIGLHQRGALGVNGHMGGGLGSSWVFSGVFSNLQMVV